MTATLDRYIPGVPCWADTSQPDEDAAATFYSGLFGWDTHNVNPPEAPGKYLIGAINGREAGAIAGFRDRAPQIPTWNTYIWVESADATAAAVKDAGGAILAEPFDVPGQGRMAVFADREGAAFLVWEPKEHRGATHVNEHGGVNFNDLYTRDPQAAKEFYGAVFGWGVLDMGDWSAWTLPGYAEHLEKLNPGTIAGAAEMGAPDGFTDVVATIVPITDDTHPRWGITFGVNDADAVAAKVTELGGRVISEPVDIPWVRTAVVADPAGAVFSINQFKPENAPKSVV